uniref:Armadillo repeat-containing protein 6 n=1 Tax=Chlamydomonas euryale TaxID=1486919 RepID=A0A7R9V124_9CHLO|mmetsp:Transcript_13593/g.39361  ORF Transcript_13593/g.39361 Transcript_13593/m.39361 type:complete len:507 (+) Transcript_13593:215-1735(+)
MSQKWPPPKPKLAQEDFDEAVKTNIDDFDMAPEEAVQNAIEEFTVQGYDLSAVVKAAGGVDTDNHPLTAASAALAAALESSDNSSGVATLLEAVEQALSAEDAAEITALSQVAIKSKCLAPVLDAARVCADDLPNGRTALLLSLAVARQAMGLPAPEVRDSFAESNGSELLVRLMDKAQGDAPLSTALALTAEAAMTLAEKNKQSLFVSGFGAKALSQLSQSCAHAEAAEKLALTRSLCASLASLVNSDDPRAEASHAFKNTLQLAKDCDAANVLLQALRATAEDADSYCATLAAVARFAANDEICRQFADGGCVEDMLAALKRHAGDRAISRGVLLTLRQLANSDAVKTLLAEHGALQLLVALCGGEGAPDDVVEHALGLLASMMLRQPDIASQAASVGADDALICALSQRASSGAVLRQACAALRNMVVRNPELRAPLLAKGAEERLRAAKSAHAKVLSDVASAALRDLGLDNYSDAAPPPVTKKPINFRPDQEMSEKWVIDRS